MKKTKTENPDTTTLPGVVATKRVSDAEVEAAGRVLYGISWGDTDICDPVLVRAALDAAREVRNAPH